MVMLYIVIEMKYCWCNVPSEIKDIIVQFTVKLVGTTSNCSLA